MTLTVGVRLGPYEIVSPIGAGGMGEVYRARDTRLDRTVAIKVLLSSLAGEPELRERFDREARAISSLNHPHICTLYDVGHEAGSDFLVLEYLEGQTLADRTLSVSEAITIAIQIADALDRAHRSGIVHRDLKPANVMLTKSGAKLLDFGLAKAAAPAVVAQNFSMLPTTPPALTAQGTILGTFQYMAPEQIEGFEADARTDIFAFGALLFEMLTGRRAFEGRTRAQLIGAILKDEPPPVSTLQPLAPKALDRIVNTCLAKAPEDRWQTARDLLRELRWVAEAGPTEIATAPHVGVNSATSRGSRTAWLVAGGLAAALVASAIVVVQHVRETPAPKEVVQFTIPLPDGTEFGGPPAGGTGFIPQAAISPDGRNVVFVANSQAGYQLWVRPIDTATARLIPGTGDAGFPFWSPDSRFIGFFAGGQLKKVPLAGGPAIPLCDAAVGRGGTWSRDNVIVFAPSAGEPLQRVSAAGGTPAPVSVLDTEYGESGQRWPYFLPDGRHFLYTGVTGTCCPASKPARIRIGTLDSKDVSTLLQFESSAVYASGHVFFDRVVNGDGPLMAQPFDPIARQFTGEAFPLAEHLASEGSRYASFSVSDTGVLLFAHGTTRPATRLTWFDREGKTLGTVGEPASYMNLALSRDDARIAVTLISGTPENRDIWMLDPARGTQTRLTFDPRDDSSPVWSPDGLSVVFQGNRPQSTVRQKLVSGTVDDEELVAGDKKLTAVNLAPTDWSADGRFLAFNQGPGTAGSTDIWVLPLSGDRKAFALLQTAAAESNASFSPDGRWIAYQSSETGVGQVYVQPFPSTGGKYQISKDGGTSPTWRADGKELFFLGLDTRTVMAATIEATGQLVGAPRSLFSTFMQNNGGRQYAVAKDGKRFLVNAALQQESATTTPLTVIVNWQAAVQK